MMRALVLGALVGSVLLLAPPQALAAAPAVLGLTSTASVLYAQGPLDNPAEPGDAFPTGPFAGGTD
jgi:hypothetical protein